MRLPELDIDPYERMFDQSGFLAERFWEKVLFNSHSCWDWIAGKSNGYGMISIDNVGYCAHRVAYEMEVGPIPDGLVIDHLCRNRGCVRPDHMELVTLAENTRRGNSKKEPFQWVP